MVCTSDNPTCNCGCGGKRFAKTTTRNIKGVENLPCSRSSTVSCATSCQDTEDNGSSTFAENSDTISNSTLTQDTKKDHKNKKNHGEESDDEECTEDNVTETTVSQNGNDDDDDDTYAGGNEDESSLNSVSQSSHRRKSLSTISQSSVAETTSSSGIASESESFQNLSKNLKTVNTLYNKLAKDNGGTLSGKDKFLLTKVSKSLLNTTNKNTKKVSPKDKEFPNDDTKAPTYKASKVTIEIPGRVKKTTIVTGSDKSYKSKDETVKRATPSVAKPSGLDKLKELKKGLEGDQAIVDHGTCPYCKKPIVKSTFSVVKKGDNTFDRTHKYSCTCSMTNRTTGKTVTKDIPKAAPRGKTPKGIDVDNVLTTERTISTHKTTHLTDADIDESVRANIRTTKAIHTHYKKGKDSGPSSIAQTPTGESDISGSISSGVPSTVSGSRDKTPLKKTSKTPKKTAGEDGTPVTTPGSTVSSSLTKPSGGSETPKTETSIGDEPTTPSEDSGIDEIDIESPVPVKYHKKENCFKVPVLGEGPPQKILAPSDFSPEDLDPDDPESYTEPAVDYTPNWVTGYKDVLKFCPQLQPINGKECVYPVGSIVVIHDIENAKQRHYTEHTHRVTSVAVHPCNKYVASAQTPEDIEPDSDDEDTETKNPLKNKAHVRVWDDQTRKTLRKLYSPEFDCGIMDMDFSFDGTYVVIFDMLTKFHLWKWETDDDILTFPLPEDKKVNLKLGPQPWSPWCNTLAQFAFCAYASKDTIVEDDPLDWVQPTTVLTAPSATDTFEPKITFDYTTITSINFVNKHIVTGDINGNLILWDKDKNQKVKVDKAHSSSITTIMVYDDYGLSKPIMPPPLDDPDYADDSDDSDSSSGGSTPGSASSSGKGSPLSTPASSVTTPSTPNSPTTLDSLISESTTNNTTTTTTTTTTTIDESSNTTVTSSSTTTIDESTTNAASSGSTSESGDEDADDDVHVCIILTTGADGMIKSWKGDTLEPLCHTIKVPESCAVNGIIPGINWVTSRTKKSSDPSKHTTLEHCEEVLSEAEGSFIVATDTNKIYHGNFKDGLTIATEALKFSATAIIANTNSDVLHITSNKQLLTWDVKGSTISYKYKLPESVTCIGHHPKHNICVVGNDKGQINILDSLTYISYGLKTAKNGITINCLEYSPDGEYLAAGLADCIIYVFKVTGDGKVLEEYVHFKQHYTEIIGLDWSEGYPSLDDEEDIDTEANSDVITGSEKASEENVSSNGSDANFESRTGGHGWIHGKGKGDHGGRGRGGHCGGGDFGFGFSGKGRGGDCGDNGGEGFKGHGFGFKHGGGKFGFGFGDCGKKDKCGDRWGRPSHFGKGFKGRGAGFGHHEGECFGEGIAGKADCDGNFESEHSGKGFRGRCGFGFGGRGRGFGGASCGKGGFLKGGGGGCNGKGFGFGGRGALCGKGGSPLGICGGLGFGASIVANGNANSNDSTPETGSSVDASASTTPNVNGGSCLHLKYYLRSNGANGKVFYWDLSAKLLLDFECVACKCTLIAPAITKTPGPDPLINAIVCEKCEPGITEIVRDIWWSTQNCQISFETLGAGILDTFYNKKQKAACTKSRDCETCEDPPSLFCSAGRNLKLLGFPACPIPKYNKSKCLKGHCGGIRNVTCSRDNKYAFSTDNENCFIQWKKRGCKKPICT